MYQVASDMTPKVKKPISAKADRCVVIGWSLLQNTRDRAHARASHGHGSPLPQQCPSFRRATTSSDPRCSLAQCIWDDTGIEEWGPQTSGSVTNTKHILSSSLEQSANLESSASPQGIESKLPSPRFSCQVHAHLRLPSPSADTSAGLGGTKVYLNH